jgi:hypothetical protein
MECVFSIRDERIDDDVGSSEEPLQNNALLATFRRKNEGSKGGQLRNRQEVRARMQIFIRVET